MADHKLKDGTKDVRERSLNYKYLKVIFHSLPSTGVKIFLIIIFFKNIRKII